MKKIIFIITIFFVMGCNQPVSDFEIRHKYFIECLEKAPAGPQSTHYNDWSEVVSECETAAYYQSFRYKNGKGSP